MNRLIFYSTSIVVLYGLSLPTDRALAESADRYLDLCQDTTVTDRLKVEACQFAYENDRLTATERGLALAHRAVALRRLERDEAAFRDAQKALRLAPENPAVQRINAEIHGSPLGQAPHAIASLNQVIDTASVNPGLLYDRAMAYFRQRDFDRALADIQQLIAARPEDVEAHRLKGQILTSMMRNDESVAAISDAIRLAPNDPWLHMERAGPALVSGQFALARDDLDIALTDNFENSPFWRLRGAANYALGDFEAASKDFARNIKLEPTATALLVWRFLADFRSGKATKVDAEALAAQNSEIWPSAVFGYFAGKSTPETAASQATAIPALADTRRSQLSFFLGEWALLQGESADMARNHFEAIVKRGVVGGYADVVTLGAPHTVNDDNILEFALAGERLKEMAP